MGHDVFTIHRMLDDLSDEVDTAQEQMNFVMDRMSKLLKTKGDSYLLSARLGLLVKKSD